MNMSFGTKLFAASTVLVLAGCFSPEPEPAPEPAGLSKTSATSQNGCPKYTNFMTSYPSTIQACVMNANGIDECADDILGAFEPIFTCLDVPTPTVNSIQDLSGLGQTLGNEFAKFETDQSKAVSFIECLCGGSSGGASGSAALEPSVTSAAGSSITGSASSGASSSSSATTSSGSGSKMSGGASSGSSSSFGN